VLIVAAFWGWMEVLRANTFAATTIQLQAERGQTVISSGPYALVRHPMYAFALFLMVGAPLLLGSLWGLAWLGLFVPLLAARVLGEEAMLTAGLEGYADYARRVRFRMVPGRAKAGRHSWSTSFGSCSLSAIGTQGVDIRLRLRDGTRPGHPLPGCNPSTVDACGNQSASGSSIHLALECANDPGRARRAGCDRRGAAHAAAQGQQKGEATALAPLYCRRNFRLLPAISRVFSSNITSLSTGH
jgi:phospholipid methyltransferase